jgi:hypothetical protein
MTTKATKAITNRLQIADEVRQRYRQTMAPGVTIDEAMDRNMWVHVSKQLRSGDVIELRAEDGAWYGETLVTGVTVTATGVHIPTFALLSHVDLAKAKKSAAPEQGALFVKHNGPADMWVIIRNPDKVKVEKGIPTKEAAEARMAELQAA